MHVIPRDTPFPFLRPLMERFGTLVAKKKLPRRVGASSCFDQGSAKDILADLTMSFPHTKEPEQVDEVPRSHSGRR